MLNDMTQGNLDSFLATKGPKELHTIRFTGARYANALVKYQGNAPFFTEITAATGGPIQYASLSDLTKKQGVLVRKETRGAHCNQCDDVEMLIDRLYEQFDFYPLREE